MVTALEAGLAQQVRSVCAAVREVLIEWQTRRPAGEEAARAEVLAAAMPLAQRPAAAGVTA